MLRTSEIPEKLRDFFNRGVSGIRGRADRFFLRSPETQSFVQFCGWLC